ncbi:MAG TPA: ATP-binding protein [Vicinamibacterales bacterium]|jgi:signal transduction histidine kinase
MTPNAYALLGLTAIVASMVGVLTFALLRFAAAARDARHNARGGGVEMALMSAALQEAVGKLKAQERATAARAEASERLSEEIIASLTAGLLVTGLGGEIRILNPAGRRMIGVADAAGSADVQRALDDLSLSELVHECLSTGNAIVRRTIWLPEPRHGVSHLGVTVSPLSDATHAVHGAICLFTDLTAVKDLEEQLRLKESLATVGELTAGIAHEFRNGLATILGYSKLFDLASLPDSYKQYVQGIRAETESLSEIVTNFLSFARPAELALSRVDVRSICERAAEEVRNDARLLGGDVALRGDFGFVEGDEVLLRQAFSNLLRNSLDACITAAVAPAIVVQSEIDALQKTLRISFNDNGGGIPAELRERVFRPFFTSKRSGTGLGLALVQKIIVFHNGRIVAGSSPSGGASMQISLPIAD